MTTVSIIYFSGSGHTAKLAEAIHKGAASIDGVQASLITINGDDIVKGRYKNDAVLAQLDASDAIIFGSPTYMGGPSGVFKSFADATAGLWAEDRWQDKVAAGFTNSGHMHGDKLNTLIYFALFAAQHGMHWVNLGMKGGWDRSTASADDLNRLGSWLGAMAQSNKDEGADVAPPLSDLRTAEALGRRVAAVTRQWAAGRVAAAAVGVSSLNQEERPRAGIGDRSAREASHA